MMTHNSPEHTFPLWRIKELRVNCPGWNCSVQSDHTPPSSTPSFPHNRRRTWENTAAAAADGLAALLPIHLLNRRHGNCSPRKVCKAATSCSGKSTQLLKLGLPCPFHRWLHVECTHCGDRLSLPSDLETLNFPTKVFQACLENKNWRIHFWIKSIFKFMPENRRAQWRCPRFDK